ncbi:hypothetical protein BMF94_1306 [Rhodotorula taiwanensis]|uniref:Uncharacterized protein n=1 Tax=Rhodotorula taiwanensis TaxID=741276 RepID=A0A2S5BG06_9BASI|nr:hypothetical protein BMF94_1306 [Rhodotorula taiwanensis]
MLVLQLMSTLARTPDGPTPPTVARSIGISGEGAHRRALIYGTRRPAEYRA